MHNLFRYIKESIFKMVIYKTTNLITKAWYVGKDSLNKSNYLGSGKILKLAIKKYGIENFTKEILDYAVDLNELAEKEIFYIKQEKETNENKCYNITDGGSGGDTFTNHPNKEARREKQRVHGLKNKMTKQCRDAANDWRKKNHKMYGSEISEDIKEKNRLEHSDKVKEYWRNNENPWKGKKHSEEAKMKMSEKLKGENHPNWGKPRDPETVLKMSKALSASKNPNKIKVIDKDLNETILDTMRETEAFVKGSRGYIKKCLMGKKESYKDYKFEYIKK